MNPGKFNLKKYMIHRPPMLLVDTILEKSDDAAKTSFKVDKNCMFVDAGGILARPVLIEIAAQSFAAADIFQKTADGKKPVKGFLVGVRDFIFYGDVKENETVICFLKKTDELGQMHIIKAHLEVEGKPVSDGELRIFELADGQ